MIWLAGMSSPSMACENDCAMRSGDFEASLVMT
jgi:hypothetical protein